MRPCAAAGETWWHQNRDGSVVKTLQPTSKADWRLTLDVVGAFNSWCAVSGMVLVANNGGTIPTAV